MNKVLSMFALNLLPRGQRLLAPVLTALILSGAASAQVTYTYTGNVFQYFSCGLSSSGNGTAGCQNEPAPGNPLTTYTATDKVTATLTFTSALPANMPFGDVTSLPGFQLSLSDGQQTLTSVAHPTLTTVKVSTDANGNINSWEVFIDAGNPADSSIQTNNFSGVVIDQGVLACCDPQISGNLALNFSAGSWSNGSATPSGMVMNLMQSLSDPALGLTTGQINSLMDKLNNVLLSIQAGADKQAINQLNAFVSSVQSSEKNGKVSQSTASTLTQDASGIIAVL